MKKQIGIILSLIVSGTACAQYNLSNITFGSNVKYETSSNSYSIENAEVQANEDAKHTYKNLRLYFLRGNDVIRNSAKNLGNYFSLQDAIVKNRIKITEMEGGSVNTLIFENTGLDTILILAGEIVTGGKQDRVVGSDLLLIPKSGKIKVAVFCVEHGRWTPNGTGESFKGYYGVSNAAVRKQAIVDKNQSGVWKNVAEVNKKNNVNTSTGTYTALKNADSLNLEVNEYMKFFMPMIAADSNVIGFVAVTGDTIISCDIFGNNRLFQSHASGLIKAAAVEACSNGSVVKIMASQVLAFLTQFLSTDAGQEEKVREKGAILLNKDKKVHMNYYKTGKAQSVMPVITPLNVNRMRN